MRINVAGKMAIRDRERLLAERDLPGNQGRLVLAILALERRHPIGRDRLADELWPNQLPKSWETALRAVISKIRTAATRAGFHPRLIESAFGCYQLRAGDGEVDVDVASDALHLAEAFHAKDDFESAGAPAVMTCIIARRPFLPGLYNPWTLQQRDRLRDLHVSARQILIDIHAERGSWELAARHAQLALELDPYDERLHRRLIVARARAGDRLGAAHVFSRYRNLIETELGVAPSKAITALLERELGEGSVDQAGTH